MARGFSTTSRIDRRLILGGLASLAFSGATAAPPRTISHQGDGRTPFANRGRLTMAGSQAFTAETPQGAHNIRIFPSSRGASPLVRVELRPGERRPGERDVRERVEFRSARNNPNGVTRWYAGAFRVDDFVPDAAYNILMQWHSNAAIQSSSRRGPWLRFALPPGEEGRLEIQHRGSDRSGRDSQPIRTVIDLPVGQWHTFVVEARTSLTDGRLNVWIDGRRVVQWSGGLMGDFHSVGRTRADMGFMKFGFYRWGMRPDNRPVQSTAVAWYANIEEGSDLSARIHRPLPIPDIPE